MADVVEAIDDIDTDHDELTNSTVPEKSKSYGN